MGIGAEAMAENGRCSAGFGIHGVLDCSDFGTLFRKRNSVNARLPLVAVASMTKPTAKNLLGPEVARLRTERGLSQAALAATAQRAGWDISRETLAKIESGVRCVTDIEAVKLAKVFKVRVVDLFPSKYRD